MQAAECPKCGSPLSYPDDCLTAQCSYCGSILFSKDPAFEKSEDCWDEIINKKIIAKEITIDRAIEILKDYMKMRSDNKEFAIINSMKFSFEVEYYPVLLSNYYGNFHFIGKKLNQPFSADLDYNIWFDHMLYDDENIGLNSWDIIMCGSRSTKAYDYDINLLADGRIKVINKVLGDIKKIKEYYLENHGLKIIAEKYVDSDIIIKINTISSKLYIRYTPIYVSKFEFNGVVFYAYVNAAYDGDSPRIKSNFIGNAELRSYRIQHHLELKGDEFELNDYGKDIQNQNRYGRTVLFLVWGAIILLILLGLALMRH